MNVSNYRPIWTAGLLLLSLLACAACGAQPGAQPLSEPGQSPGSVVEQFEPPTPVLESTTVELDQVSPRELDKRLKEECPNVDSALLPLIRATDYVEWSESSDIKVKGDKVQVLLVLAKEDIGFLHDFEVEVGTQQGIKVQAYVPIDRLCDLAKDEGVLAIRLPGQAVAQ